MLTTRNRSTHTSVWVCHWCRHELDSYAPYRTPTGWPAPCNNVGYIVCGPDCPARPADTRVYTHQGA